MVKQLDYDNVDWSQFFYYDIESKSCLKWNITSYSAYGKKLEIWPGKDAGTLSDVKNGDNKAWKVNANVNGKYSKYSVHRIISVLHGNKVNGQVIDHINGISADNRIENMRVTTQDINARNRKIPSNCPYGIQGVGFQQDKNGNTYFTADYANCGKRNKKCFPIKRLGYMEAFKQAVIYRQKMIDGLNSLGAGYTERHSSVSEFCYDYSEYKVSKEDYAKSFRNTKMSKANTSGTKGVAFTEKNVGHLYALATWNDNGKQRAKSFSVKEFGLLPAFKLACEYRANALKELYKE
jgi:hypothetical protein